MKQDLLILEAKSKKARELVRKHGNIAVVRQQVDRVNFSANAGPWLDIELGAKGHRRWMHKTNDFHFSISRID